MDDCIVLSSQLYGPNEVSIVACLVEIIWTTRGENGTAEIVHNRSRHTRPKDLGKDIKANLVCCRDQRSKVIDVNQDSIQDIAERPALQ